MDSRPLQRLMTLALVAAMLIGCTGPAVAPTATATSVPPTEVLPTATSAPTETPAPTSTPTLEPSDTPTLKPTATSTVTPTATATKIAVTVTPRPTKTVAATTVASAPAPRPVAIPAGAPLNVAVTKLFNTGQGLLGELNRVLAGSGGSCQVVMPFYDAFASAPAYDVSQASPDEQAAYDLYRQAIDKVNGSAIKVRRICERGGGAIGSLDIQEAQRDAGAAVPLLGRAIDLVPAVSDTADTSAPGPQPTATKGAASSIALSDLLINTRDGIRTVASLLDGAQTNLDAGFCQQFVPQYNTLVTQVILNDVGRDPGWVEQYNAYKVIVNFFQSKLYRAREVCDGGGGKIGPAEFGEMRQSAEAAAFACARAYDQLKAKNLLGQ